MIEFLKCERIYSYDSMTPNHLLPLKNSVLGTNCGKPIFLKQIKNMFFSPLVEFTPNFVLPITKWCKFKKPRKNVF